MKKAKGPEGPLVAAPTLSQSSKGVLSRFATGTFFSVT
jgi:hypothetical protein